MLCSAFSHRRRVYHLLSVCVRAFAIGTTAFRGGDLEVLCLGFVFHALFESQYIWRLQLRLCNFGKHTSLFLDFAVFSAHSPDIFLCAQGVFSSYAKKASFPLFSGMMASDGAHAT